MNNGLFCDYCESKLFEPDRTCPQCGAPTKYAVSIPEIVDNKKSSNYKKEFYNSNEISFIAGTYKELIFNISNSQGTPIVSGIFNWKLYQYGNPNVVFIKKVRSIKSDGTVSVTLTPEETKNMSGKYVQDPKIEVSGYDFYVGKSIINIIPSML